MAFIQAHFFSKTLNVVSAVWALLPEEGEEAPRVLTLLHGYSDDHTIWMRHTALERYAARKNLAVIMPAVNHSYYCNEACGERYWDYVSDELPRIARRLFGLDPARRDCFTAGLSMGGYGAMKLALTFPERYAAAGSFSGAVDVAGMAKRNPIRAERIFGDALIPGSENDLAALLKKNGPKKDKPRLYVSCGTEDFLYDSHCAFWPMLRENGWDVTHKEIPGRTHEWALWDEEIKAFIDFIDAGAGSAAKG